MLGTIFRPLINEGGKILGVGRNEPCPCGSGIKYKRCCLGKKPRTAKFTFDFDEPTRITSFSINRGKFEVFGSDGIVKPALTKMTVGYSREKGLKVLNEVTTQNNMIFRDPEKAFIGCDMLYAIDTNTKEIGGLKVSTSCIIMGTVEAILDGDGSGIHFYFSGIKCLEFWNLKDCPERVGWKALVQNVMRCPQYEKASKIIIITDHDLSRLDDYNNQKRPIVGDFYLPSKFVLSYASSDAGREYLPNKLLDMCDQYANKLFFDHVQTDGEILKEAKENKDRVILRSWTLEMNAIKFGQRHNR